MSLDRTLKSRGGLAGRRSVLTRAERIERLTDEGEFDPQNGSPLGLRKVRTVSARAGGGKKAEKAAEAPAADAAAPKAAEPAAKPAAKGKK